MIQNYKHWSFVEEIELCYATHKNWKKSFINCFSAILKFKTIHILTNIQTYKQCRKPRPIAWVWTIFMQRIYLHQILIVELVYIKLHLCYTWFLSCMVAFSERGPYESCYPQTTNVVKFCSEKRCKCEMFFNVNNLEGYANLKTIIINKHFLEYHT